MISGFFAILVLLIGCVLCPYLGSRMLKQRKKIQATATATITGTRCGEQGVEGFAQAFVPFHAPWSQEECVYCEWSFQQISGSGKTRMWVTSVEDKISPPFFIEDVSGRILIEPEHATMDFTMSYDFETSSLGVGKQNPIPPHIIDFIRATGIEYLDKDNKILPFRVEETAVKVGEPVYAMGTASNHADDFGFSLGEAYDPAAPPAPYVMLADEEKTCPLYVGGGTREAVTKDLFKSGLCAILIPPPISAIIAIIIVLGSG